MVKGRLYRGDRIGCRGDLDWVGGSEYVKKKKRLDLRFVLEKEVIGL